MKNLNLFLLIASFSFLILFSSCEKWNPWEEGGGGSGGGEPSPTCTLTGTLVRIKCGISDLDNLWIKADNGKYYQPCDASIIHTMDLSYQLVEGSRIRFGYSVLTGSSICDNEFLMLCPVKLPERTKIKITCIQPFYIRCGTPPPSEN